MTDVAYYAIPDPTDPDTMTFWRREGDSIAPWPSKAKQGPVLYRHQVPAELRGRERSEWVYRWVREVRDPWWDAIRRAVADDTGDARALFARITTRCWCCGKKLTDPISQLAGLGPDCRRAYSAGR